MATCLKRKTISQKNEREHHQNNFAGHARRPWVLFV